VLVDERRHRIASLVSTRGAITVAELSEQLGVSAVTIRSDLEALEQRGLLKRNHGGAVATQVLRYAPDFLARASHHRQEKERIAQAAAELIQDGDRIILDAGSTTLALARQLHRRELSVITNSMYLLNELANAPRIELVALGGTLYQANLCFVGPLAEAFLDGVHVTTCFLGVNGITPRGISAANAHEAGVKRRMLDAADRTVVLSDSSKVGSESFVSIAPLDRVDRVITGCKLAPSQRAALDEAGLDLVVV